MSSRKKPKGNLFNKDNFYLVVIGIFSLIFIFFAFIWKDTRDLSFDGIRSRLTTLFAIISAVAFWLQFKKTERLNESNYVMNLNKQFIDNKNMTKIEHELELYYNQYVSLKKNLAYDNRKITIEDISKIHLGLDLSRTSEDCQKLIDYLVYLESLAIMVDNGVIRIEDVDDLFSYRLFLAVNNPVVQEQELLPYADFYRGTYELSKKWTEDHDKNKIPMYEFSLTEDRLKQWREVHNIKESDEEPYTVAYQRIPFEFGFSKSCDDKKQIAKCIYQSDPYIYPEAFGDDEEIAVSAISKIIGMDGSLFDYDHLYLAKYNGQICGVVCIYDGNTRWDTKKIKERLDLKNLSVEQANEGFDLTSSNYFGQYNDKELGEDTIELVVVCVRDGFRTLGIAKEMLTSLFKEEICLNKDIKLAVLADNDTAIHLYEKQGFTVTNKNDPIKGFGQKGHEPDVYLMERKRIVL